MELKNLYEILDISCEESKENIEKAYQNKLKKNNIESEIQEIKKAYYILCNEEARKNYDITEINEFTALKQFKKSYEFSCALLSRFPNDNEVCEIFVNNFLFFLYHIFLKKGIEEANKIYNKFEKESPLSQALNDKIHIALYDADGNMDFEKYKKHLSEERSFTTGKMKPAPHDRMLACWGFIMIIWSIYRHFIGISLPLWFDEFIMKPMVFILPLYYFIKNVEKRPFLRSIGFVKKTFIKDILIGCAIGSVFLISSFIIHYVKHKSFLPNSPYLLQNSILLLGLVSIVTAISEEILSRGFVLKRLFEKTNNLFTSTIFASILFLCTRIPMLFTSKELTGQAITNIILADITLSIFISILFLLRKHVMISIIIHAFYIFSLYLFIS